MQETDLLSPPVLGMWGPPPTPLFGFFAFFAQKSLCDQDPSSRFQNTWCCGRGPIDVSGAFVYSSVANFLRVRFYF